MDDFVIKNPDAPASPKQIETIQTLARYREIEDGVSFEVFMAMFESWTLAGIMTMGFASRKIDEYKGAYFRRTKQATEPGYYVKDYVKGEETRREFFVVVKTKDNQRVYAKHLVKTGTVWKWEYMPGAVRDFAGLTPLTLDEAAEWGKLHGHCIVCGRTLSDPPSVQRGIGPSCAKKIATIPVS